MKNKHAIRTQIELLKRELRDLQKIKSDFYSYTVREQIKILEWVLIDEPVLKK